MSEDFADQAAAGTLPEDPTVNAKPVTESAKEATADAARLMTVKQVMKASWDEVTNQEEKRILTTCHYEIDRDTGGFCPEDVWVIAGKSQWGKCLGGDVPVLRFDGTEVMARDVRVGDLLMGPDSKPRRVLSLSRGLAEMFRVVPQTGESWTCNEDHILVLADHRGGGCVKTEISVRDFLQRNKTWRRSQVMFHGAVEFQKESGLPVDPWFLGVWYGDGTKCLQGVHVTTPDSEIIDGMREVAETWGLALQKQEDKKSKADVYRIGIPARTARNKGNPILAAVRKIYGDGASLPVEYLTAARTDRLQFLAGLIDSDGYKKGQRHCEIITKSQTWARQIRNLARGLGFQCRLYEKTNVRGYEDRVYWRAVISGDLSPIPTRVVRKQFQQTTGKKLNRSGFTVESVGPGEYFGWTIDGDGLFLLADFTVTHNTSYSIACADENIQRGFRVLIVSGEDRPSLYGERLMIRRTRINRYRYKNNRMDQDEFQRGVHELSRAENLPVYLDARGKSVEWASKRVRKIVAEEGIDLIFWDYLQCFHKDKPTQDQRLGITYIARVMTDTIKTTGKAGALLSQVTPDDKAQTPDMYSIRDSKDVANAAEVVAIGFFPKAAVERDVDGRKIVIADEGARCMVLAKNKPGPGPGGRIYRMGSDASHGFFNVVSDPTPNNGHWADDMMEPMNPPHWGDS